MLFARPHFLYYLHPEVSMFKVICSLDNAHHEIMKFAVLSILIPDDAENKHMNVMCCSIAPYYSLTGQRRAATR